LRQVGGCDRVIWSKWGQKGSKMSPVWGVVKPFILLNDLASEISLSTIIFTVWTLVYSDWR